MPKISKKPPVILPLFFEFVQSNTKKVAEKQTIKDFESLLEKKWDKFVEFHEQKQEDKPPKKKRKIDVVKNLAKSMQKVHNFVEQSQSRSDTLQDVRSQILKEAPET